MAKALLAGITLWLALACPAYAIAPEPAPKWAQLSSQQQEVLAPLAKEFDTLTTFQRKKWVLIARRYPTMKPEAQQRLQTQMRTWAGLSQQERRIARENFKKINTLPPDKKLTVRQKWEEYQRLPESEKRKLAESGAKPPHEPAAKKATPPAPPTLPPAPPAAQSAPAIPPAPATAPPVPAK
jgi:hypothetical protein